MYDAINSLSIKDVIEKVGLKYESCGAGEYSINKTDGRKFNENKNFATDFSNERGQGGPFDFVKSYFNVEDQEVFSWFEKNFGVTKETTKKVDVLDTWNSLKPISDKQHIYLKSRGITNGSLDRCLKDFNGSVGCLVYKNSKPASIVGRKIDGSKQRFTSLKGTNGDGIYSHKIDKNIERLYVVEGMFDFLTIRQYTTNVVGLKNWSNGIEEVKKLSKDHEIVFIPDTDEAGKNSVEHLQKYIDFYMFDLSQFNAKDINEIYVKEEIGEKLLEVIEENIEYISNGNIKDAFDVLEIYQKRYKEFGKLGYDSPFPEIDKYTEGMIPGKVYTIGAYSNTGKSKLSYYYTRHFLLQGRSVMYGSLEVDKGMVLGNIISCTEEQSFFKVMRGDYKPDISYYKKLKIFDDVYNIDEIEELVNTLKPDVFVLDFIQNVNSKKGSQYEKMAEIAKAIQRTAIQSNAIIISLSQMANSTAKEIAKGNTDFISLKGAGELYASSDVIFVLYREDEQLKLKIEKNKYGKRGNCFDLNVDRGISKFTVEEDILF